MGKVDFFNMIKRIFLITTCLFFTAMLASCRGLDYELRTVGVEFGQFPRVVYIAGVDTELDFSESTLVTIHANGKRNEFPFPITPSQLTTVEHNIDFNAPGVYKVEVLRHPDWVIPFFIQVIDKEMFNELSGTFDENCDYTVNEEE